ncbi:hypothetical protein GCM10010172_80420 [Paractinoplanes ferrugineus]|uniref:Uncharacterized protein n=1 Tax=Paractinoplanes ferrugineus TaxID=113564 RepID=A0A919IZW7_9ACTN|nr:hypothetical protein [Actinoplanes ferrugineus]GIE10363.1 hypothetical protein Afe05nite_22030 [Actinoplanes ferrugineus]
MQPKTDSAARPTIKRFLHGELAKVDDEGCILDLVVELTDGVVHHHLGGQHPGQREVATRYEVGPAGDLTVWSVRLDRDLPPEVRRVITYSSQGWLTVEGPALPLDVRVPEPAAMVDPRGWQDSYKGPGRSQLGS